MAETVKPYKNQEGSKKEQVAQMFNNISARYDFLNHMLSLGIDKGWRRKTVKAVLSTGAKNVLDIATGTGDLAIALGKAGLQPVVGVDISAGMLEVGREKIAKRGLTGVISMELGDSEALHFPDHHFDAITVAFGVRNFEHRLQGLQEMHRVLKPGGVVHVLEFSQPEGFPFKQIYRFYFKYILPTLGKWISKDASAYTYLPESVDAFPNGKAFLAELEQAGFSATKQRKLTFGVASLYTGVK